MDFAAAVMAYHNPCAMYSNQAKGPPTRPRANYGYELATRWLAAKSTSQVLINQSAVMPSNGTMMIGMSTGIGILFFLLEEIKKRRGRL